MSTLLGMDRDLVDLSSAVFLRRDALADGYTDPKIRRMVQSGVWHRLRRGAYVEAVVWDSLSAADRHRALSRAVLRTAHPDTVLSHYSAGLEYGAPVWDVPLGEVHTTRLDAKGARREAGKTHHRGVLPRDHVRVVNGVPVTIPARCAVEMTTVTSVESALVTVNGLLHDQLLTVDELGAMARATRFWPRSLATDLVVRLAEPRLESAGETRFDHLCFAQRLPRPTPQVEVRDEQGHLVGRVDFAWVGPGVFVEFDGKEKYRSHRHEGESLEDYLMREKRREERICALTGWVCIRIMWADLADPAGTAARLRAVLASRAPLGA